MNALSLKHSFLVKTERLYSCPYCDSREIAVWCSGYDRLYRLSDQEFTYSRCKKCDLRFLSLRPIESEIRKFYPQDYGPYQGTSQCVSLPNSPLFPADWLPMRFIYKVLRRALISFNYRVGHLFPDAFPQDFQRFYKPQKEGLRLLDFGCGSDAFLNWAREQGWKTMGVDFSESAVDLVRRSGHKALLMSPAVLNEIEDESLDFVRMNHVLEHLYHPKEILTMIKRKMKLGATLHIGVPNPHSITSKIFRSRWLGLDCPRHLILYSHRVLKKFVSEVGFSEIKILHETLTKDFARSLGYFMFDRGRIKHDEVEKMMYRQDLSNLLYIPARLASVLSVADRFHLFGKNSSNVVHD